MNKFSFTLMALLLVLTLGVKAGTVDASRARQVATTFLNNNGARTTGMTDVSASAGFSNVYVFTTANSFVLIAADDCVRPILGYSLTGRFDVENMPDNKRAWIQEYSDEIRYAIDNQLRASSEVIQQWRDLVEGNPNSGRAITVVAPLIQTHWGQGSPYNMLCPSNSVTGCVATAMAQVMKYWNYPTHGIGWYSYIHPNYGELSADFQSTTYDWNNMINSYSGSSTYNQKLAVATLMYHCGVSVDMNYSPDASGAVTAYVADALKTYFNYSTDAQFLSRANYSDATWINMLKSDLNQSRPIQYSGSGSGGGHSFVCDGYNNNNYFHFNWGWEGYCDEYYSINNLNPGPGGIGSGSNGIYNDYQGAIFGVHPSECTASAPSNLTYSQNGRNVTLSWSAASGASSYKVYRNNSFIGNVSSTSYSDVAPFGNSVYYVRSVDSQGRLSLSSNAVTVTVGYLTPVVDDLAATVSGNNVHLTWTAPDWCYPATPTATMTYGDGNYNGYVGYSGSSNMYWGHRYLASNLSSYNNMKVYKVSFYANETGSYQVYVYKGTTSNHPQTQLLQQSFSVGTTGWHDIDLSTPLQIDASKDLWVFIYDPEYRNYPATYCNYSGSEGNYYSTNPTSWVGNWDNSAFLIRTFVTDGTYTYNVYRNGSCIANSVSNTSYNDNNLASGVYNYYVKTNYYAGETNASNQVSVQIGGGSYYSISASANPTDGGTVSGAGSYLAGQTCELVAMANSGYSFTNWTKNGTTVSTNATYSFTVTESASFVANFTANTPPSQDLEVFAEYYPDANNPNSQYVKVYWMESSSGGSFSYDFEDSVLPAGWTTIDADGDGYNWMLATGLMGSGYGHNGSNDCILSQSYDNSFGALTPDNYLVSEQVTITNGSHFSFYACAQDASWAAEHFGVFVSLGSPNPNNFQEVQSWTLTAKGERGPRGTRAQGNWYYYDVDLSAFTGTGYIAIRHYNCTDWFYLDIDDIAFGPAKADRSSYRVYRANCQGSNMQQIADNVTGNQYIDNGWSNLTAGNYKYGVSVVNGGSTEISWSNCIEKPNSVTYYSITATANPSNGGTISGAGSYAEGQVCTLIAMANEGYTFNNWTKNGVEVSTDASYIFTVTEDADFVANFSENQSGVTQTTDFSEGYNWWSTYIEQNGIDGLSMLQEGLGSNGITIRSQSSGYTDYYAGYGWYGSLTSINNESSYRVITNAACSVSMTGNLAVPSEHPITISQGWTWIGYVPSTAMDVSVAMSGINAASGDKLKSQQGYSDYYPGYGWFGSLNTIEPGMGLMYYTTSSASTTFTYPDNGRGGDLKANLTPADNHWVPNVYAYPDNMTVMAVVDLNDVELNSGHYELAAFANGECRGSVKLIFAEPLNHYVAFLTISGKDAAELSFRLYDTETGKEYYDAEESLSFVANAIVGDADDLYVVHFRGTAGMDEFANSVRVYPNPVACGEHFIISVNTESKACVRVEIVNALGAVVSVETSAQIPASIVAPVTAGVYTVRIITEDKGTQCLKLIVR